MRPLGLETSNAGVGCGVRAMMGPGWPRDVQSSVGLRARCMAMENDCYVLVLGPKSSKMYRQREKKNRARPL